jgi:lysine-specific permease
MSSADTAEESPLLITETVPAKQERKLTSRHISMIAIGGTIGTGLFIGSGATIAKAGPLGALIGFSTVGFLVFSIMNSLGELATFLPVSGSFTTYAGLFVHPSLSFALGWNYWIQWSISFPSELSAAGIIMSFWTPMVPSFIWAGAILIILVIVHLFGVKGFGESEYWLSLIKVVAIIAFIIAGIAVDLGWIGGQNYIGWENWNIEGAPIKNGFLGIFNVFLLAFFAFGGTELIGITGML